MKLHCAIFLNRDIQVSFIKMLNGCQATIDMPVGGGMQGRAHLQRCTYPKGRMKNP